MKYEITARFHDTESANSAAKRIREDLGKSAKIRLKWSVNKDDAEISNDLLYSPLDSAVPYQDEMPTTQGNVSPEWSMAFRDTLLDNPNNDPCSISVQVTSDGDAKQAQSAIINNGGFDVDIKNSHRP